MKGSGVEEALGQVNGPNTVIHMMSGKAISRAIRGLHLLDADLHSKLLEFIVPLELLHPAETSAEYENQRDDHTAIETGIVLLRLEDVHTLEVLLTEITSSENPVETIIQSSTLQQVDEKLQSLVSWIASRSRTGQLWLQLRYHISVIKDFILAERMKSWTDHLNACTKLLNLLAASGHLNYAKSLRLYVQLMQRLPDEHPWLHQMYVEEGRHAVQRTDHPLNGLWTDLVIEQVLMRSIKTHGGLHKAAE